MSFTTNGNGIIDHFTTRKKEVRTSRVLAHGRQRVADIAAELSRRGASAASAELLNESVNKLISLAYETDETGPCNRDVRTGKLLVPTPWGRNGRYAFGLHATEGDVLRIHLYKLMELRRPYPLFTYDPTCRQWFVNHFDYQELGAALAYWEMAQIDAVTYRRLAEQVRDRRRTGA